MLKSSRNTTNKNFNRAYTKIKFEQKNIIKLNDNLITHTRVSSASYRLKEEGMRIFSINTTALKSQRRATYKLFMWLLVVFTLFVLGLQPLMIGRNNLVQGLSGKNSY